MVNSTVGTESKELWLLFSPHCLVQDTGYNKAFSEFPGNELDCKQRRATVWRKKFGGEQSQRERFAFITEIRVITAEK